MVWISIPYRYKQNLFEDDIDKAVKILISIPYRYKQNVEDGILVKDVKLHLNPL